MGEYGDDASSWNFEDVEDQANQKDEQSLSLPFLLANQINRLIVTSTREFHDGIVLYGDGGLVRGYLPNVLESYCNGVITLSVLISPYWDEKYYSEVELEKVENKFIYHKNIFIACMRLIKRLGLIPSEKGYVAETIGEPRPKKKSAEV